jgi:hypothetical protein
MDSPKRRYTDPVKGAIAGGDGPLAALDRGAFAATKRPCTRPKIKARRYDIIIAWKRWCESDENSLNGRKRRDQCD